MTKRWVKRTMTFCAMIFFATVITLTFIPHYSCGCGEMLKEDGSLLRHLVIEAIEFFASIVRWIIS